MRMMIMSDLHLECGPFIPPDVETDLVILAGDIWKGVRGIVWARRTWPDKEIIFVPGNHEYYGSEINRENDEMRRAGKAYDVHFLNRDEVVIGGVRFLGVTLWTDFKILGRIFYPLSLEASLDSVTDFRVIEYGDKTFMPRDSINIHNADIDWLKQKLLEPFDGHTVVVTHHLPSIQSVPERFRQYLTTGAFASNLDDLIGCGMVLWIHGHTHDSCGYELNDGVVFCNPRGYTTDGVHENPYFDPGYVVTL
jgi:predicted phosphodiesterase